MVSYTLFAWINSDLVAWGRAEGLAESHCLFAVEATRCRRQLRRQIQAPRQRRAKNQSEVCYPNRLSCQRLRRVLVWSVCCADGDLMVSAERRTGGERLLCAGGVRMTNGSSFTDSAPHDSGDASNRAQESREPAAGLL